LRGLDRRAGLADEAPHHERVQQVLVAGQRRESNRR
jgi:hypothetical protein